MNKEVRIRNGIGGAILVVIGFTAVLVAPQISRGQVGSVLRGEFPRLPKNYRVVAYPSRRVVAREGMTVATMNKGERWGLEKNKLGKWEKVKEGVAIVLPEGGPATVPTKPEEPRFIQDLMGTHDALEGLRVPKAPVEFVEPDITD